MWGEASSAPEWLLVSHVDGLWALGPPVLSGVEARAFFRNQTGWIALFRIEPPALAQSELGNSQGHELPLVEQGLNGAVSSD